MPARILPSHIKVNLQQAFFVGFCCGLVSLGIKQFLAVSNPFAMFTGQRFNVDLSDEEAEEDTVQGLSSLNLVGGIKERDVSEASVVPPTPPSLQSGGFPQHKDRKKTSAFKRRRAEAAASATRDGENQSEARNLDPRPLHVRGNVTEEQKLRDEKRSIDEENKKILETLGPERVEEEREELLDSLDPALLNAFKRRAERANREPKDEKEGKDGKNETFETLEKKPKKKSVSFNVPTEPETEPKSDDAEDQPSHRAYPFTRNDSFDPAHNNQKTPTARGSPNLDPNSPSFFEELKNHYFPDLPHNPRALSWMRPPTDPLSDSPADPESPYSTNSKATQITPSSVRFSFRGDILPPSTSLSLPTSLGLHHHGVEPDAAGYTISELALLSRSAVPTQRCIAWQILGRILFKLGQGDFGKDEEGERLTDGLWKEIEKHDIAAWMLAEANGSDMTPSSTPKKGEEGTGSLDTDPYPLTAEQKAYRFGKHASAQAYALDAVWLWVKGGGINRGVNTDNLAKKHMQRIAESQGRKDKPSPKNDNAT